MRICAAIKKGACFLFRQYKTLVVFVIILAADNFFCRSLTEGQEILQPEPQLPL